MQPVLPCLVDTELFHAIRFFEQAMVGLQIGEPPELAKARTAHLDNPVSSAKALALAVGGAGPAIWI